MRTRRILIASVSLVAFVNVIPASAQTMPFYFRADLGWSGATTPDIHDRITTIPTVTPHTIVGANGTAGVLDHIGNAIVAGAGAGMQFTPFLRGEIMYTYRGTYNLDELDQASTRFKSDISSDSVMVNGFLDYPISGVIPYLGFGVGWAGNHISHLSATSTLVVNPLATASTPSTAVALGGTSDNFAWQVMLGLGFPVYDGVVLDVFYRYFDGGHIRTDAGTVLVGTTPVGTYGGLEGGLHSNELVASVRFAL